MNNPKPYGVLNPDFTQTLWTNIEKKLGRKLSPVENQGIFQRAGMFKEWFFAKLESMPNEEVERIVDMQANRIYGWSNRPDKPERKGLPFPHTLSKKIIKPSLWQRFIEVFK